MNKNLLIEIGTEELPPKALRTLAQSLHDSFTASLNRASLSFSASRWFATPRRLAVYISDLTDRQEDTELTLRGPSVKVAYDADGNLTQAARGWAKSNHIAPEAITTVKTDKGEWISSTVRKVGQRTEELVPEFFQQALKQLPIPKLMHWGAKREQFVRPVHTLTMLYGDELIPGTILGLTSSRTVQGHRFLGAHTVEIRSADSYEQQLRDEGNVIADYEARKAAITDQVKAIAAKVNGQADLDDALLEEVTSIVEAPYVFGARFEERFLSVPSEALVYTMKGDQKYFPIYDAQHHLLPDFAFVSNINPKDPFRLIDGNERVVRPRLSDAEFFFKTDRKHRLEDFHERLKTIVYQKDLGTIAERSEVVKQVAGYLADVLHADRALAERAAYLAKCDLATTMVGEFTDTQGIMGMHYAELDQEDPQVSAAIFHQYLPRFQGDELPHQGVPVALSLAEKIVTLAGIIGINQLPKGDKDPFGLRRAAIGIIRIVLANDLDLDLRAAVEVAVKGFGDRIKNAQTVDQVTDYVITRLKAYYSDQNIGGEIFQAVYARKISNIRDFDQRAKAVITFKSLPESQDLAMAFKRVNNILGADTTERSINDACLREPQEQALVQELRKVEPEIGRLCSGSEYTAAFSELAKLRGVIDNFFEHVMVNDKDPDLKNNRLAILGQLRAIISSIADISVLY